MAMMHPLTQMPVWIPGWMQPWLCPFRYLRIRNPFLNILNGKTWKDYIILITLDYYSISKTIFIIIDYSISSIRNPNFGIPEDLGIIRNPLQNTYINITPKIAKIRFFPIPSIRNCLQLVIRSVQGLAALRGASLARRPRRLAALVAGAERCAAAAGCVVIRW